RDVAAGGAAGPEPSVVAQAPGENVATAGQRQAVLAPGPDGLDGRARPQADRDGSGAVGGGAVAQLAVTVEAPGQQLAGAGDGEGALAPGDDGFRGGARRQCDGHRDVAGLSGAITEFPLVVEAPGEDPAGAGDGQAVELAGGDAGHGDACGQRDGDGAVPVGG